MSKSRSRRHVDPRPGQHGRHQPVHGLSATVAARPLTPAELREPFLRCPGHVKGGGICGLPPTSGTTNGVTIWCHCTVSGHTDYRVRTNRRGGW